MSFCALRLYHTSYDAFDILIYTLNLGPETMSNAYLFYGEQYDEYDMMNRRIKRTLLGGLYQIYNIIYNENKLRVIVC